MHKNATADLPQSLTINNGESYLPERLQPQQGWIELMEAGNLCFVIVDAELIVLYCSIAAGALFEQAPLLFVGKTIAPYVTHDPSLSFPQWFAQQRDQHELDSAVQIFETLKHTRVKCRFQRLDKHDVYCLQFTSIKLPGDALGNNDEKYKTLIEQAYDGILIYSTTGVLLEYNEKSCNYLGYSYQEMGNLKLTDLFFEEELKERPISLKKLYQGGAVVDYRKLKRKDGSGIMMELNSKMMHDGTILVFGRDVTERVAAEVKLNEERRLLRVLIDNLPDPIYIKNLLGEKIIANKEDQLYMGVTSEAEVLGKTDIELYPGEVGDTGHRQDMATMQNNLPLYNQESYFVDASGIAHWLLVSKIPLLNQKGEVMGLLGIGREITHRKEMEHELTSSIERYRNVAKATFDAIWDWDMTSGDIYRGEGFETLFGYVASSKQGYTEDWNSLIHPEDFEAWHLSFKNAIRNKAVINWQGEYRFKKANDEYAFVADKAIIIRDIEGTAIRMVGAMQDISLQKKTEHILAATHKRYRALVENSSDGVAIIDRLGRPLYISPAVFNILGYTEDEALQMNVFDITHPEDAEPIKKTIEYTLANPGIPVKGYPIRLRHKDGSWRWMEETINNMLHDSTINGFIENFRDVTERIAIEARVLAEKELSESLVNNLPGIFMLCGSDDRLIRWNKNLESVSGISASQLISTQLPDFFAAPHRPLLTSLLKSGIREHTAELDFVTKNGEVAYYVSIHKIGYENEDCLMVMCFDINERKKQESELAFINERYEYVTMATSDVVWDWDLINNVLYWGENFYTHFGHPRVSPSISLQQWTEFLHPDDRDRVNNSLHNMIVNLQHVWKEEYRFKMADGDYLYIQDNGVVLRDDSGNAYRIIGAMHDVTRQKQEEQKVKILNQALSAKALALANSNKELEKFAYVASHDLQEPLRMVTSFLTLLEKKYRHLLDDTANTYIQFAVEGAHRMRLLILDLLEYSRVSTGYFENGDTDLNQVMSELKTVLTISIDEAQAQLQIPVLPVLSGTKRVLIFQLFQNLIGNALKYRRNEPVQIRIGYEERPNEWQFEIADNGIGIDPVFAEKIFIIFQRLHNKNEYNGTGIGLTICKKIVELHAGKIWVKPNYPYGSIFSFTISKDLTASA
jgi:PAS domain S-box-containing protein